MKMMNQFLGFDDMLTPKIIQIVFIIGVAIAALAGLAIEITGLSMLTQNGIVGLGIMMLSVLEFVVGTLIVRIYCELAIVLFKIHECLVDIRNSGRPHV